MYTALDIYEQIRVSEPKYTYLMFDNTCREQLGKVFVAGIVLRR